jgi:hypothetical protein
VLAVLAVPAALAVLAVLAVPAALAVLAFEFPGYDRAVSDRVSGDVFVR